MTKKLQNRQKKNLVAHEADHEIVQDQDLVKGVLARKIQIKGSMTTAVDFHRVIAEFRSIDFCFLIRDDAEEALKIRDQGGNIVNLNNRGQGGGGGNVVGCVFYF